MNRNDDAWTVFWCALLGPILLEEVTAGERSRYLRQLSRQEHLLPNGQRKRLSYSTLRRHVRRFQQQRVAGLRRCSRNDRGRVRKDREALLARAVELKREQPRRSPHVLNQILAQEFGRTIPASTLNRHLRRERVTRRHLGVTQTKIRCRWTRTQPNALWVGDFSEGPCILHNGQAVTSHLSVWIDCHSRYVVEGRYYLRENLDILVDSLLRAWGAHGASLALYVDNAKVYHSQGLQLACTELNIELLHRPPRDPSPGGIIERLIQTTQHQFEEEVRAGKILTLTELNRFYQAWLHADYHQTKHGETGQTPAERYQTATQVRRHVHLPKVHTFFHQRSQRKIHEEFSDVRVDNRFYAVDARYRGDRVCVIYDPFSALDEVRIESLEGVFLAVAKRYERERGAHPQPPTSGPRTPLDHSYLQYLVDKHHRQQQRHIEAGVPYDRARAGQAWPFVSFANAVAKLLGRKGKLSDLSPQELEGLRLVHQRHPRITAPLLEAACERADPKTIPVIVFHLQQLLQERT